MPFVETRCAVARNSLAHLVVAARSCGDEGDGFAASGGKAFRERALAAARASQYQYQSWGNDVFGRHDGFFSCLLFRQCTRADESAVGAINRPLRLRRGLIDGPVAEVFCESPSYSQHDQ